MPSNYAVWKELWCLAKIIHVFTNCPNTCLHIL